MLAMFSSGAGVGGSHGDAYQAEAKKRSEALCTCGHKKKINTSNNFLSDERHTTPAPPSRKHAEVFDRLIQEKQESTCEAVAVERESSRTHEHARAPTRLGSAQLDSTGVRTWQACTTR